MKPIDFACVSLLFLGILSCQTPLPLTEGRGQLRLQLTGSDARTVLPGSFAVVSTTAFGLSPLGTRFSPNTHRSDGYDFIDLPSGTWTFTVEGYGSSGKLVARGSTVVVVNSGTTQSASVTLVPTLGEGDGTADLRVSWPDTVTVDEVSATVTPVGGLAQPPMAFTLQGNTARLTTALAVGSYLVVVEVKSLGRRVASPRVESVVIAGGLTTAWSAAVMAGQLMATTNDMLAFSIADPVAVGTINGQNIRVVLPFGTPLTALVSQFSASALVRVGTVVQKSSVSVNDFSQPVTYSVVAQDGAVKDYRVEVISAYTVTYDSSGGPSVPPTYVTLAGQTLTAPEPVLPGSVFAGWYRDAGFTQPWTGTEVISSDLRLFARWTSAGVKSVTAGDRHTLILKNDGSLWGVGHTGLGDLGARSIPALIATNVTQAFAGYNCTFFVKADHSLWGDGSWVDGQLGIGPAVPDGPQFVMDDVSKVAVGYHHTLILKRDGSVWATGKNDNGQLGDGTTTNRDRPVPISFPQNVRGIAAGWRFSLFLLEDGTVWGSGSNSDGELLLTADGPYPVPIRALDGATDVVDVAAAGSYSVFLKADGSLWSGRVLQNSGSSYQDRTAHAVDTGVVGVDVNEGNLLYWKVDHTLWLQGRNDGRFGNLPNPYDSTPRQVAAEVKQASSGRGHTVIVKTDGTLWATGSNLEGQLGIRADWSQTLAKLIATDVVSAAAGWDFSLFLKANGDLFSMGYDQSEALGNGSLGHQSTPTFVRGGTPSIVSLAAGSCISLFLRSDGTVWGAGDSPRGALGPGASSYQNTPVQVASGFQSLFAGSDQSFLVTPEGNLWAMGNNAHGVLGLSTAPERVLTQITEGVMSVSSKNSNTYVVKTDGSLWTSGDSTYGLLGDGSTQPRLTLASVMTGVKGVFAGPNHAFILKDDDTLWGLGSNYFGGLGDGTRTERTSPVLIMSEVASAAAGAGFSLFLKKDGTLWATGANWDGQLGTGNTDLVVTPVQVATSVKDVWAGDRHSLYLKNDGSLWGMGSDRYGALGQGIVLSRESLTQVDF